MVVCLLVIPVLTYHGATMMVVRWLHPRNSYFFGGNKLLLPDARPGSKTNFVYAKLYVYLCTQN